MDKEKINNLKDSTTISSSRILMGNLIYNVFSDFNKTTLLSIFKPNNDSSFLFNEEVNDAYDYELNNKSKVLKDKIFINPLIYLENEVDRINDELNVQQREFDEKYDLLSQQLRFKYSKKEVIFQINEFLKNQNFDDEIDDKIELELVILAENIYYHLNNILICYLSPTNDPRIGEDYLEYLSNDTKNPYYTYKHIYTIVEQFLKSIFLAPLQQAYEIEFSTTESIKKLIDLLLKLENNDIITNSSACLLSWIDLQKDADN